MIEEVLSGLVQWNAFHTGIDKIVHSSFVLDSGTLVDPMEPDEGIDALAALATPQRIVLTNRHHYRHSASFVQRFDCPVYCHKTGLGHFKEDCAVRGFSFDEQLVEGVRALELGSICDEETTLLLDIGDGVLSFGDGLTRDREGSLAFVPDGLLGEDPRAVQAGLLRNLRRMLDEDFDTLLFAHSEPVPSGGRMMLSDFLSHEA
jgi:glyoxylase-like metal-dependent hydrolase (beta-lactamase superfamily II)